MFYGCSPRLIIVKQFGSLVFKTFENKKHIPIIGIRHVLLNESHPKQHPLKFHMFVSSVSIQLYIWTAIRIHNIMYTI